MRCWRTIASLANTNTKNDFYNDELDDASMKLASLAHTASKLIFKMVSEEADISIESVDHDLTKFAADSRVKVTHLAYNLEHLASVLESIVGYRSRGRKPPTYITDQGDEAVRQFVNSLLIVQEIDEERKLVKAKLTEIYGS